MNLQRITRAVRHASRLPELATCVRTLKPGLDIAAGYVGLARLELPRNVRFRNGLEYRLEEYYDVETLWQINFHLVYPLAPTDRVIVDAGANVGLFTCWAASSNSHSTVFAIEPSPANLARLHAHVRSNHLDDRVTVIPAALSGTAATVYLSDQASASQMHHVLDQPAPGTTPVRALTLRELLAAIPASTIDFLKMDIEGSEYPVLLSTSAGDLRGVRRISVEYHEPRPGTGFTKALLREHLVGCGFSRVVDTHPHAMYGILHARRD